MGLLGLGRTGLLTLSINVTRDGCIDHQKGIADDESHAFFTRLTVVTWLPFHQCNRARTPISAT
jgi:hypothetical protein